MCTVRYRSIGTMRYKADVYCEVHGRCTVRYRSLGTVKYRELGWHAKAWSHDCEVRNLVL